MDRRSRLWQRKSSERSPGDQTESSGSISSHSERFSDDQVYPTHITQSPEVTSKAPPSDEDLNESVETLKEKLSAALLNCKTKEDMVKQHSKVAEEAVSGWEKAESEVLGLKQQLDAANQKNSALKDRIGHLDGALKECMRQLRQAREEKDRNISEVVARKAQEWDFSKSILENRLADLQAQLQAAKTEASASIDFDLRLKLEAAEKEKYALNFNLYSRVKELEVRTTERDLSIRAAEAASKQRLESMKKVAKLEAECRILKASSRKALSDFSHNSFSTSSVYVESLTDSESDIGERVMAIESDIHKVSGSERIHCESNQTESRASAQLTVPSVEITLMDDFLDMERLAAFPETKNGNYYTEAGIKSDHRIAEKNILRTELETMIERTTELESKLKKMETEKGELEMTLTDCQNEIQTLKNELLEADLKLEDLQTQLDIANGLKYSADKEVKAFQKMTEVADSQLKSVQSELNCLLLKVGALEEDISKERTLSAENVAKCQKVENELLMMKHEAELLHLASTTCDLKIQQDKELELAANKFAECQKTIASLGQQLKSLARVEDILLNSDWH